MEIQTQSLWLEAAKGRLSQTWATQPPHAQRQHILASAPQPPLLVSPNLHTLCAPAKGTDNLSVLLLPLPWLRMSLLRD